jgi:hypothetical protein
MKLKQKDFPEEIRQLVAENPEAFGQESTQTVIQAYKDFKDGNIDLSGFETLAKKQITLAEKMLQGESHLRNSRRTRQIMGVGFRSIRTQVGKFTQDVKELHQHLPSAGQTENGGPYAAVLEYLSDGSRVKEIRGCKEEMEGCIEELDKLEAAIEGEGKLFKQRLVTKDGVVEKKWVLTRDRNL